MNEPNRDVQRQTDVGARQKGILAMIAGLLLFGMTATWGAELLLADAGRTEFVIVIDPAATAPELTAAAQLASTFKQITGAEFPVQTNTTAPARAILVGQGEAARRVFDGVPFDSFATEEVIIRTKGDHLLLAGGRPSGTLYAVSRFLQQQCGVRWWTPWASRIPKQPTLRVGALDVREKPIFEYREVYWYPAFDADWSWKNFGNGDSSGLAPEKGGRISYKGFVHTFYQLVPPDKHFAEHPEWFSLIKGKRMPERAQLCLTNPKLRDFTVERVKQWLRESPEAGIVSVSQNDCMGACECADCKALDDAEGTHAATMLAFVNYIAEKIEPEFPHVAVDTLAYQYTRKPPKTLKPRGNVVVRLCSIECNFREPHDHPSNAAFADDIRGWSKLFQRLYIWDYTTDFAHYVQPHPNWFVLGPNVRFFRHHNVRGVFEQGAYQSHGSEMSELRAWVLAQLLWNPDQDDRALINEFLEGYYGPDAAPHLRRYLALMHDASKGHHLTCSSPSDAPHLRFKPLAEAEKLWQQAETAAANNPEFVERIRLGHLAVRYVWLSRWTQLRNECDALGVNWPLPESRKQVADDWMAIATGVPGKSWTRITMLNEAGLTPEQWVEGKVPAKQ
ncbi:MAG: DUF4838 domain-containing protein [Verrucomicrobiales bacterium]